MAIHATGEARQNQKPYIPSTMRAAALDRFGGPEVLTFHELPVPTLDANEMLIAVHTAGVGPWDADMRGGWWPEGEPTFPLVLGTDGSGTVVDAGGVVKVTGFTDALDDTPARKRRPTRQVRATPPMQSSVAACKPAG